MDSRKHELKWLVKSRLNSIMFQILWTTAPILVSVISFLTFVAQGNELTLGVAFTVSSKNQIKFGRLLIRRNADYCTFQHDKVPFKCNPHLDCSDLTGSKSIFQFGSRAHVLWFNADTSSPATH